MSGTESDDGSYIDAYPDPELRRSLSGRISRRFPTYEYQLKQDPGCVPQSPTHALMETVEARQGLESERIQKIMWLTLKRFGMKWHYLTLDKNYDGPRLAPPGSNFVPCLPGYQSHKYITEANRGITWWPTIAEANAAWLANGSQHIYKKEVPEATFHFSTKRKERESSAGSGCISARSIESTTEIIDECGSCLSKRVRIDAAPDNLSPADVIFDLHDELGSASPLVIGNESFGIVCPLTSATDRPRRSIKTVKHALK